MLESNLQGMANVVLLGCLVTSVQHHDDDLIAVNQVQPVSEPLVTPSLTLHLLPVQVLHIGSITKLATCIDCVLSFRKLFSRRSINFMSKK